MASKKPLAKRSEAALPIWERAMNAEQLEVIRHTAGPIRCLAQAGSGKTRALVHRIARMVDGDGIAPERILAVTFSRKAADEMNHRVEELGVKGARVGTWHSLCLQILREDAVPAFVEREIDEKNRAKYALKDVLGFKGMDWKGADFKAIERFIGVCKANLWEPESEEAYAYAAGKFFGTAPKAIEAFKRYNVELGERGLLPFDDFLVEVARHLADETNRASWAARWDYVMQDEAQDANHAQCHIASLLARDHGNYMVVGDVAQAIYGFRGSKPEFLANFDQEWPGSKTVIMSKNYRSTRAVVDAANNIIRPATLRVPSDMSCERNLQGTARAQVAETHEDEANHFVRWVKELLASGTKHADITGLVRMNAQTRALEEALLSERIPYVVVGGVSFYERKEVRDLLGYLRVATGRGTADDIKRCINSPFRYLGNAFVERLMEASEDEGPGCDWANLVERVASQAGVQRRQIDSAKDWARIIRTTYRKIQDAKDPNAPQLAKDEAKPAKILDGITRETRYLDWISKEEGEEESTDSSGIANVREMIRVAERFGSCDELLKYIDDTIHAARKQSKQAGGQRVTLMSVHRSKGLEWPYVWIAGANEMVMPHMKGDLEEERRIAYVAVTRAREEVVMSYVRRIITRVGIRDADPSRFLVESGVALRDEPIADLQLRVQEPASEALDNV